MRSEQEQEARIKALEDGLKWVAQTHHQAYHEESFEKCPKATCQHVRELLYGKEVQEAVQDDNRRVE